MKKLLALFFVCCGCAGPGQDSGFGLVPDEVAVTLGKLQGDLDTPEGRLGHKIGGQSMDGLFGSISGIYHIGPERRNMSKAMQIHSENFAKWSKAWAQKNKDDALKESIQTPPPPEKKLTANEIVVALQPVIEAMLGRIPQPQKDEDVNWLHLAIATAIGGGLMEGGRRGMGALRKNGHS
jgi:hypothetical protein